MTERPQSPGEEIANSLSHGLGFVAALASAPILVLTTAQTGRTLNVIGAAIFAVTMVLLYCASTIYHAVPHPRAKALFKKLDHGAIFLLIAGTYTPFTLGALSGPWGWTLLSVVWTLALVGVTLKAFDRIEHPLASLGLYLLMDGYAWSRSSRSSNEFRCRDFCCLVRGASPTWRALRSSPPTRDCDTGTSSGICSY